MDPENMKTDKAHHRALCMLLPTSLAIIFLLTSGCNWNLPGLRKEPPPSPLSANPTKSEVVAHLNDNINRIQSWQSTKVNISAKGPGMITIPLSGKIAVANPQNFRLTVESLRGHEADFGSNPERFWIWKRGSNANQVVTCQHHNFGYLQSQLPIPIHPDWLMDSLGVIPIDESEVTMLPPDSETGLISLVSSQSMPGARPIRRVILVDPASGQIVAHSLHDESGKTIALATIVDYTYDAQTGAILPSHIELDWPENGAKMTLRIENIEINPNMLPQQIWTMPSDLHVLDVGQELANMRSNSPQPAGRVRLGGSGNRQPQRYAANNSPYTPVGGTFPENNSGSQFEKNAFAESSQFNDERQIKNAPPFEDDFNTTPRFQPVHPLQEPAWDDSPSPTVKAAQVSKSNNWWD